MAIIKTDDNKTITIDANAQGGGSLTARILSEGLEITVTGTDGLVGTTFLGNKKAIAEFATRIGALPVVEEPAVLIIDDDGDFNYLAGFITCADDVLAVILHRKGPIVKVRHDSFNFSSAILSNKEALKITRFLAEGYGEDLAISAPDIANAQADAEKITVNLTVRDGQGSTADSTTAELSIDQISDIIDNAAELILALRTKGEDSIDFKLMLAEIEEALVVSGVIEAEGESDQVL